MIETKIIEKNCYSGAILISSSSNIEIKDCTVNRRGGFVTHVIHPKIKGFTKRFITKCKYGL